MTSSKGQGFIEIHVFGFLRRFMDEQGLPYTLERAIPDNGVSAHWVAQGLSIPPEKVEAVFCNGRVTNIYDPVFPGDRVSFFPYGTPGPYRVFLGIARENRERTRREKNGEQERGGA